jgi:hypothetical protein
VRPPSLWAAGAGIDDFLGPSLAPASHDLPRERARVAQAGRLLPACPDLDLDLVTPFPSNSSPPMFGGSSAWGQQNNQQQQQGQQQQPAGGGLFGGGAPAAGGFGSTGGTSPLPASLALLSSASPQEGWVTIPGV